MLDVKGISDSTKTKKKTSLLRCLFNIAKRYLKITKRYYI